MTDPHWTSYVGMVTGISGAIMYYISYRRSNKLKSLDLRLKLRKAVNELQQKHKDTNDIIIYADKSRNAVTSATGNMLSGRMKIWESAIEADTQALNTIANDLPDKKETFTNLNTEQLESKLVQIHQKKLSSIHFFKIYIRSGCRR